MTIATRSRRQEKQPDRAQQIHEAIKRAVVDCPVCEGAGIFLKTGITNPNIMEPPEEECWACRGRGEVSVREKKWINYQSRFSWEEIREAVLLEKHGL